MRWRFRQRASEGGGGEPVTLRLGIRAKLNLGLGLVLLAATLVFGASYAWLETATRIESERRHLIEIAALARLHLETTSAEQRIDAALSGLARSLAEATGSEHHFVLIGGDGEVLATAEGNVVADRSQLGRGAGVGSAWRAVLPASLSETIPVALPGRGDGGRSARLVVQESLDEIPASVTASLLGHLALAASIAGLAMGSVAWLVRRLVIGPLREVAAATQQIASGGEWRPFLPNRRASDEIGVLVDGLAQLSRRLVEAVRRERFGSAHLVAERVRRELESPIRDIDARLAMLEGLLPAEAEEARLCREIEVQLTAIAETRRRLLEIPETPSAPEGR
jgi:hypothetical protein